MTTEGIDDRLCRERMRKYERGYEGLTQLPAIIRQAELAPVVEDFLFKPSVACSDTCSRCAQVRRTTNLVTSMSTR